jgi:uncharacterized membrane protein
MRSLKFIFPFLFVLLLSSCYYDKEELLYPGSCTAPASPLFAVDVLPLLNSRCNSCHGAAATGGGILLNSYTEVKKYADNGKLLGSIQHASGFSPMPKNAGKMATCEIQKIQNWITSGALNN